jgi:hypothetical protein
VFLTLGERLGAIGYAATTQRVRIAQTSIQNPAGHSYVLARLTSSRHTLRRVFLFAPPAPAAQIVIPTMRACPVLSTQSLSCIRLPLGHFIVHVAQVGQEARAGGIPVQLSARQRTGGRKINHGEICQPAEVLRRLLRGDRLDRHV